ncbi:E3 ubiquitin-protein ligase TRIM47-like isoform X2 [Brachyhypopomus gauderio]|uniref:E3 ubiquitin-protein ligase TRIM47-like isoform X2 n=1 Tax=Brachyhypopomus gauderio TaxID=698409 RepID=UPI0040421BC9
MAEARVSVNFDEFSCSICLDLLKDPVSIPCGHSFCMTCITTKWDQDVQRGVYSCPLCRKNTTQRPELCRNTLLAEMVEKLRNTHIADRSFAGPEDLTCDVCVGQKCKAVKSCLECLASYCVIHHSLHNELNPGNKHRVIDAKYNLAKRICYDHNKLKEVFCCTEKKFMCHECALNMCRGHETTTVSKERSRQEKLLEATQAQIQQKTKETENRMKELSMAAKHIKSSAKSTLNQKEEEVHRVEDMLKHLEKELAKLKQRDAELAQFHLQDDDFLFLKMNKTFSDYSTFDNVPKIQVVPSAFLFMQQTVRLQEKWKFSVRQNYERFP